MVRADVDDSAGTGPFGAGGYAFARLETCLRGTDCAGLLPRRSGRARQVGGRDDSSVYIAMKKKAGAEVGIDVNHVQLSSATTSRELLDAIGELNTDHSVHGIIVQV